MIQIKPSPLLHKCCSVLSATLTKYCVLAVGDSKIASAVDTTICSVRLLGTYLRSFFFHIMGIVCHSSYPVQPKLYFYDWSKKRWHPNTANGCHSSLNSGDGDTDINSLPCYSLPAFSHSSSFVDLVASFSAFSLFIHRKWMGKKRPVSVSPPHVWVFYHKTISLRVLHRTVLYCLQITVLLFPTSLFGVFDRDKQKWMAWINGSPY